MLVEQKTGFLWSELIMILMLTGNVASVGSRARSVSMSGEAEFSSE